MVLGLRQQGCCMPQPHRHGAVGDPCCCYSHLQQPTTASHRWETLLEDTCCCSDSTVGRRTAETWSFCRDHSISLWILGDQISWGDGSHRKRRRSPITFTTYFCLKITRPDSTRGPQPSCCAMLCCALGRCLASLTTTQWSKANGVKPGK